MRPLIVPSEDLSRILDKRKGHFGGKPEDADYCFQLRVSKYAMRSVLQDTTIDCIVLKNGKLHPMACGTPYCKNWHADGNCSMLIAQIREHLGANDSYITAFDNRELAFQCGWPEAELPEFAWVEGEEND